MSKNLKKLFLTSPILLAPASVLSCNYKGDDSIKKNVKSIPFENLSNEYRSRSSASIDTYYFNGSKIPYVSVKQALAALEGVVDNSRIQKGAWFNIFHDKNYQIYRANGEWIKFDWINETIEVSHTDAFSIFKRMSQTDYGRDLKLKSYKSQKNRWDNVIFDLKKYDWQIYAINKNPVIPLFVFNTLFLSPNYYNLHFNGSKYYGAGIYDSSWGDDNSSMQTLNEFENVKQTQEQRIDALNSLNFTFDHFYGLAEEKGFKKSGFDKWLDLNTQKDILSSDPKIYTKGYFKALYGQINELHTSFREHSYYKNFTRDEHKKIMHDAISEFKESHNKYYSKRDHAIELGKAMKNYRDNAVFYKPGSRNLYEWVENRNSEYEYNEGKTPVVRFLPDNKSAVITFDEFEVAPKSKLTGNPEDAYMYDTFELIKYALDVIYEYPKRITNIILDISQNGGGSVAALYKVIGMMKESIESDTVYVYEDTLNNEYSWLTYNINIPKMYKYKSKSFMWYLLTSPLTFSAANALVAYTYGDNLSPFNNLVSIIGKDSGGGACSIVPIVLSDGTKIIISSQNKIMHRLTENQIQSVENGFAVPDKYKLAYGDFYNDYKLAEIIKK
ncbi:S41 family peptidase [Mycoplasmopsis primatum]|uniref:S41 family peptidase n=1 Tax=Mycoplasmopsis primatum TaxID=55604 RepID=UPI0004967E17|nr:S41 family peptidase [Mycoplasmopsis primatum]